MALLPDSRYLVQQAKRCSTWGEQEPVPFDPQGFFSKAAQPGRNLSRFLFSSSFSRVDHMFQSLWQASIYKYNYYLLFIQNQSKAIAL